MTELLDRPSDVAAPLGLDREMPEELWVLVAPDFETHVLVARWGSGEWLMRAWLTEADAIEYMPRTSHMSPVIRLWPTTFEEARERTKRKGGRAVGVAICDAQGNVLDTRYWA